MRTDPSSSDSHDPTPAGAPIPRPAAASKAVPDVAPAECRWGVCCSGGGIRSAAYSLGGLQILREERVLERSKYLAAVSGGAYMASALAVAAHRLADDPQGSKAPDVPAFAPGSPEERYLRNNSSYMAPNFAGALRLVFHIAVGAALSIGLLCLLVVAVAGPLGQLYRGSAWGLSPAVSRTWLPELGLLALISVVPVAVGVGVDLWSRKHSAALWDDLAVWSLGLSAALLLFLVLVPQGVLLVRVVAHGAVARSFGLGDIHAASGLLGAVGGGAFVASFLGALSAFVARRRMLLLKAAAFAAGPTFILALVLVVADYSAAHPASLAGELLWMGSAVLLAMFAFAPDLNTWSMHGFYRDRLTQAFYPVRNDAGEAVECTDELAWTALAPGEARRFPVDDREAELQGRVCESRQSVTPGRIPQLVVCAAANVTARGSTPPGRRAVPFVFTATDVGVPREEVPLKGENSGQRLTELTVGESVAMSGAAVSPLMGKKTISAVRLLMTMFNVRLGVWLPNPHAKEIGRMERLTSKPRPWMLSREALGQARADARWLYVTDGGHFDNLGVIELLRRGCTTIFCLDGGGDPAGSLRALGEAVALARSELQVDIDIDPRPVASDPKTRRAEKPYVIGSFRYRVDHEGKESRETGTIIYCRCAVTDDAPADVLEVAKRSRRFPFHSTMDQLFDDEQFESYRALGAHAAATSVEAWRVHALRARILEVLREHACKRKCVWLEDLEQAVREEREVAGVTSLGPVLAELAAEDAATGRPAITAIVVPLPSGTWRPREPMASGAAVAALNFWRAVADEAATSAPQP